jgi:hypothetical protein
MEMKNAKFEKLIISKEQILLIPALVTCTTKTKGN